MGLKLASQPGITQVGLVSPTGTYHFGAYGNRFTTYIDNVKLKECKVKGQAGAHELQLYKIVGTTWTLVKNIQFTLAQSDVLTQITLDANCATAGVYWIGRDSVDTYGLSREAATYPFSISGVMNFDTGALWNATHTISSWYYTYDLKIEYNKLFSETGSAIYGPFDLSSIEEYDTSLINWTSTTPANTALTVKTAVRNDSTTPAPEEYQTATDGQVIPNFTASQDLSISKLWIKVEMATTDDTVSPEMTDLSFFVSGVGSQYKIQINLTAVGRLKHPQGNVLINFTGNITGESGSVVEPFELSFLPTNLTVLFNPNTNEHVELSSVSILTAELKGITYSSYQLIESADATELVGVSVLSMVLTHIDDIVN